MLESKYVTQGLEINSKPAIAPPLANAKRHEDDGIATCPSLISSKGVTRGHSPGMMSYYPFSFN